MELVVPNTSHADRISYEQAQLVWGYGAAAGIAPWTESSQLFKRSPTSGTQAMIAKAIGLDTRTWVGVANSGSGDVLAAIVGAKNGSKADAALGILGADVADGARQAGNLRPLAFQDKGQGCSFFPDSSATAFDKQNVRDGHYPIWGPIHLITTVDSAGVAFNPVVSRLIAALNGLDTEIASKFDVIALYAKNHVVPSCAMHVARSASNGIDGASYAPYKPVKACSCYYDSLVGAGAEWHAPPLHERTRTAPEARAAPRSATALVPPPSAIVKCRRHSEERLDEPRRYSLPRVALRRARRPRGAARGVRGDALQRRRRRASAHALRTRRRPLRRGRLPRRAHRVQSGLFSRAELSSPLQHRPIALPTSRLRERPQKPRTVPRRGGREGAAGSPSTGRKRNHRASRPRRAPLRDGERRRCGAPPRRRAPWQFAPARNREEHAGQRGGATPSARRRTATRPR